VNACVGILALIIFIFHVSTLNSESGENKLFSRVELGINE